MFDYLPQPHLRCFLSSSRTLSSLLTPYLSINFDSFPVTHSLTKSSTTFTKQISSTLSVSASAPQPQTRRLPLFYTTVFSIPLSSRTLYAQLLPSLLLGLSSKLLGKKTLTFHLKVRHFTPLPLFLQSFSDLQSLTLLLELSMLGNSAKFISAL